MSILTRPIFEINLKNLLKNYQTLQKIAPHAIAAAVVKDDAYGLGAYRVAQYLYDKGQIEFLMQRTDFLSRHELWTPYVEKRIWGTLAYYKKYDLIDWEDWGKRHPSHALRAAIEAKNWDFLVKQKAHWQLLKHFRLIRFIKSFF